MADVKGSKFRVQLLEAMSTLIIGAFGLVAALAWNEAIREFIKLILPANSNGVLGLMVYASAVTVLAVVMTILITRSVKKAKIAAGEIEE